MAQARQTSPKRPGYLFLVCPDAQLIRQQAEAFAAQWPAASGTWERFCYWGDEEPPRAFWENLSLTGLLGTQRLVLVRQANQWNAAVWHRLSKALSQPLAGNFPMFCLEVGFEKGKFKVPAWLMKLPCWTFADKQQWIWRSEGVTDRNITRFIQDEAARAGVKLAQETLARFADTVPRSAEVIANEIEKLALACPPGTVATPEHMSTGDPKPGSSTAWTPSCGARRQPSGASLRGSATSKTQPFPCSASSRSTAAGSGSSQPASRPPSSAPPAPPCRRWRDVSALPAAPLP